MAGSGGVYVGVATNTTIDLAAGTSIYKIELRPQDYGPNWFHAARGDVSRTFLTEAFLAGNWEYCLYLDGDMTFPPDLLKRLLAHDKKFVGGLYFRRGLDPVYPLAFEYIDPPTLPFVPMFDYPKGGLIKCNAVGSGCWLVHRDVYPAVQAEMKKAIKDKLGMDVASVPYIMDGAMPEVRDDYQRVGADLRFSYYARRAGFDIWLDCDLDIGHISHIPIGRQDYDNQARGLYLAAKKGVYGSTSETYGRQGMDTQKLELKRRQAQAHLEELAEQAKVQQARIKAAQAEIAEAQAELRSLSDKGNMVKGYIQGLEFLEESGQTDD